MLMMISFVVIRFQICIFDILNTAAAVGTLIPTLL